MARLQGLTPGEARRFRTGRPCLDLAHTGGDGPYAVFELLHEAADVSRWLGVITGLARTPPVPLLEASGTAAVRRPLMSSQVLSLLARDAVDLFASPLASRIRVCAAPDCGLLYLDQSRTGNRLWCSMQRCGTRAKVRTHRERSRGR